MPIWNVSWISNHFSFRFHAAKLLFLFAGNSNDARSSIVLLRKSFLFFHKKLWFQSCKENTKKPRKIPLAKAIKCDESFWSIQTGVCWRTWIGTGEVIVLVFYLNVNGWEVLKKNWKEIAAFCNNTKLHWIFICMSVDEEKLFPMLVNCLWITFLSLNCDVGINNNLLFIVFVKFLSFLFAKTNKNFLEMGSHCWFIFGFAKTSARYAS